MMNARRIPPADTTDGDRARAAKDVLRSLRKNRSALDNLQQHHAAAYIDIAVQLLKQSIADEEAQGSEED
jgi:hypothetical protein